jgi:hypothetical protein
MANLGDDLWSHSVGVLLGDQVLMIDFGDMPISLPV